MKQYTNPYTGNTFNNPGSSLMDTMILHSMQRRNMYRSFLKKKGYSDARLSKMSEDEMKAALGLAGKKPGVAAKPAPKLPPATRFRPGPKRLLLDAFADGLGKTAEERKAYRTIFATVFQSFEAEAAKAKIFNDVAAAMTFNVLTHYTLYKSLPVTDRGSDALLAQLRGALNNDDLRRAKDADKQKLYEIFVLFAAYTLTLAEVAGGQPDPKLKQAAALLAGEGLRYVLKVDPAKVKISDNGLEISA